MFGYIGRLRKSNPGAKSDIRKTVHKKEGFVTAVDVFNRPSHLAHEDGLHNT